MCIYYFVLHTRENRNSELINIKAVKTKNESRNTQLLKVTRYHNVHNYFIGNMNCVMHCVESFPTYNMGIV